MKKLLLTLLLLTNLVYATDTTPQAFKNAEGVMKIWLEQIFKLRSYDDDAKTMEIITETLRPYGRKIDPKYIQWRIKQIYSNMIRAKKRDANDMYNPQSDFTYKFQVKVRGYDKWRKKLIISYTFFNYQTLEDSNVELMYMTYVNGQWLL